MGFGLGLDCCCSVDCLLFEDGFTGEELNSRYTYTPGDWVFDAANNRVTIATADSPLTFWNGAKKYYHVEVRFIMPNVGDYIEINYGANNARIERVTTHSFEHTVAGKTVTYDPVSTTTSWSGCLVMFPRSLHAYFYDVFTTTPDSDIVDCLVGFGAFGGQELPPGFPGQPDYYYGECFPTNADYWFGTFALEDLGDGFDTYSISGSVGVHVTNLYVFKTGKNQYDEQCVKIEHLCCTPCWPDGLPTTCTVTIAGASGTYHTGLFPGTDCDRGEFNGAYVCDHSNETPTDFGCYYQFGPEFHDHMNPPVSDCDILFMDIGVFLSADVDMNFSIAVSMSTKMAGGNGTWIPDTPGETVYGPEGICAGTVIPLKPESGTAAATVTLQFG